MRGTFEVVESLAQAKVVPRKEAILDPSTSKSFVSALS